MDDGGMVGLIGLNDGFGGIEVAAANATNDLSEKLESALLGGEIGEREAGVGLDDPDGGELGKIEAFGDGLSADDDLISARFDFVVEVVEGFMATVIAVETGDFSVGV